MANWLTVLPLKDIWEGPRTGRMSVADLAGMVADRLEALRLPRECTEEQVLELRQRKDALIESFRALARGQNTSLQAFDLVMCDLYDWADTPINGHGPYSTRLCWVNTL